MFFFNNKPRLSIYTNGAFIGCNSNLVSPVKVGKKAYVAAGSTVIKDVSDGALYIERGDPFMGRAKLAPLPTRCPVAAMWAAERDRA